MQVGTYRGCSSINPSPASDGYVRQKLGGGAWNGFRSRAVCSIYAGLDIRLQACPSAAKAEGAGGYQGTGGLEAWRHGTDLCKAVEGSPVLRVSQEEVVLLFCPAGPGCRKLANRPLLC